MKIIYKEGSAEVVEKKSRFISYVTAVSSEEEAIGIIESVKKRYWDARHNCYAYVIGENIPICRYSDDGEPQGTAGRPMLDVLLNEEVTNVLAVVTRYFGGTLLGTGGLVRAYSQAVKEGLDAAAVALELEGIIISVTTDYTGIGRIQRICTEANAFITGSEYSDKVVSGILIASDDKEMLVKKITEATCGQACIEEGKKVSFIIADGKPIITG